MPTHKASRNRILKENGLSPCKTDAERNIREVEYAAVPPPINSPAQPAGNCLIWLGALNQGGYGVRQFNHRTELAHRQAFRESRGREPEKWILHLCNRPYCVQPSHLYEGDAQDNSDDRHLLTSDAIELRLSHAKNKEISAAAKYRWPDPAETQVPMHGLPEPGDAHECNFIISAGEIKLCQTCNKAEPSTWEGGDAPIITPGKLQEPGNDRNSVDIQKTKTTVTEVDTGLSIVATGTIDMNLATSRSENRRRQRAENNRDMRPRLIGTQRAEMSKDGVQINLKTEGIVGPGYLVLMGRRIEKPTTQENETRLERIARELLAKSKGPAAADPRPDDKS
jgi:hypothetical protein